jgi:peptidoglycan-N-acetylglucosamine deacetylase
LKKKIIKTTYIIIFLIIVSILFAIYAIDIPRSQILGKTVYKLNKDNSSAILLTFDDGPGPQTPIIFEELKKENISAIFFVVCDHISEEEKPLLKQMSQDEQIIALHGKNHHIFEKSSDIKECKEEIENITGQKIKYYRLPYGIRTLNKMALAKELNLTIMTWNIFPKDYKASSSEEIILKVEKRLKPQAIICMHDGPENREKTVKALPEIIRYAKEKGYTFKKME